MLGAGNDDEGESWANERQVGYCTRPGTTRIEQPDGWMRDTRGDSTFVIARVMCVRIYNRIQGEGRSFFPVYEKEERTCMLIYAYIFLRTYGFVKIGRAHV